MSAWRFWGVLPDGSLTNAGHGAGHRWDRWDNVARCRRGHPAPAEGCYCGLHVVLDEAELWKLEHRFLRKRPMAAGPVMIGGRVMPSEVRMDPPSTCRAERLAILGPLLLSPQARRYRDAVADRYGLPVLVEGWGGELQHKAPDVKKDVEQVIENCPRQDRKAAVMGGLERSGLR